MIIKIYLIFFHFLLLLCATECTSFLFLVSPALLPDDFESDVVEVYALHVLPTYAHFAEFYLMLWRAFAMWAQRTTWRTDDETNQATVYRCVCARALGSLLSYSLSHVLSLSLSRLSL